MRLAANFSATVCLRQLKTFETFAVKKLTHRMKLRELDT
jgi:hypothetical protein